MLSMKHLPLLRYYLEIISVPIFGLLVLHLSKNGLEILWNPYFTDANEAFFITYGGGLLALVFFIWVWHRPTMKILVPCSHDHCHHRTAWPHLLASSAFLLHLFPESDVRYEILENFTTDSLLSLASALGFASHFLVDVIVIVLLTSFWKKHWQKLLSLLIMIGIWVYSFWVGQQGGLALTGVSEPILLLVSAFLLTMFVHRPHKPKPVCKTCTHE